MNVFCALITMTGSSGRAFLMRGRRSNAFSSGITTSVMTRSPSPWLTQRHSVAALPVERTSYPARESAWLSTVLIAESSSATSMFPAGITSSSGSATRQGVVSCEHRHQHAEHGVSRLRLAFDDPAVITDDLGDQREAEPRARRLRGHEGIEQMRQQVRGHAGAIVLHAEFKWQRHARLAARDLQPHAWAKCGGQLDLPIRLVADRLGGILHQIEKHLDELIAVGQHERQRRIV